ncbi:MAG: HXXEE domain-containing protein [Planctomycetota bacterium]
MRSAWRWLVTDWQWPYAGLLTAGFLVGLVPVLLPAAGLGLTLVFAQLPAYLVHQWEEHAGDHFRGYVNGRIGGGFELLTRPATFWINSLGVWAADLLALYLAASLSLGAGLFAGYLSAINGVVHLAQAARFREYNPGLATAVLLLLPLGTWSIVESDGAAWQHAVAVAVVVGLHAAIVVHAATRWRRGGAGTTG